MKISNIFLSLFISVIIQVVTGFIDIVVLFVKIPSNYFILKQLLFLEAIVQFIEGGFYAYWLYNFKNIDNITPQRYYDWAFTTPSMLITLIMYLIFLHYKENDDLSSKIEFVHLFYKNFNTIFQVLILNWIMLLFGYLAEIKVLPLLLGVFLGFIPFLIYYLQ